METTMRKPRDFDAELKALGDKARDLKSRKVQQLGELVLWMADKLQSDQGEQVRALWAANGKQTFEADPAQHNAACQPTTKVRL